MAHKYTKFQRIGIKWLTFFTIVCLVNSVLVIKYRFWGLAGFYLAFLLAFGHLAIITSCLMAYGLYWHLTDRQARDPDSQYIKANYPEIWRRFHPRGDRSQNTFASIPFIRDKYDDGTDDRLNEIKFKTKVLQNLAGWPFLLTIVVWLFNFILMYACWEFA